MSQFHLIAVLLLWWSSEVHTQEAWEAEVAELKARLDENNEVIKQITRQIVLDEFQAQQRIRVEGDSGIVQVKNYGLGTDPFHSYSFYGQTPGEMHDHPNAPDTIGMGEFTAVLNGVQFTTRHNDPRLFQPSTSSKNWHETEPIALPEVPPSVLAFTDINDQIAEMQEYFRAFKAQDCTIREYTPYFKPVLCYLEGAWLHDYVNIEEAFLSIQRRSFYAYQWEDLAEEARLEAYLGGEPFSGDRIADLPRTFLGLNETTGKPIIAQWHYRILCQPLQTFINTSWFRVKEDFESGQRYPELNNKVMDPMSRHALFTLDYNETHGRREEEMTLLDTIVREVPGKDNIPDDISDEDFAWNSRQMADEDTPVNMGYYNRVYRHSGVDVMARKAQVRGYADASMFMALTTQPEVAAMPISYQKGSSKSSVTTIKDLRASWMIPLEIYFTHPLTAWNPHGIAMNPADPMFDASAKYPREEKGTLAAPYSFNNLVSTYQTPQDFYVKPWKPPAKVKADNGPNVKYLLDQNGDTVPVCPPGAFTVTPDIGNGVGYTRLRYPIFPVHYEGSPIWKEFDAFKVFLSEEFSRLQKTYEN